MLPSEPNPHPMIRGNGQTKQPPIPPPVKSPEITRMIPAKMTMIAAAKRSPGGSEEGSSGTRALDFPSAQSLHTIPRQQTGHRLPAFLTGVERRTLPTNLTGLADTNVSRLEHLEEEEDDHHNPHGDGENEDKLGGLRVTPKHYGEWPDDDHSPPASPKSAPVRPREN